MQRRSFLQLGSPGSPASAPPATRDHSGIDGIAVRISTAGLEPYVPSGERPWSARRAAHLLRRAGFGVTSAELDTALASPPEAVIAGLLGSTPPAGTPGSWTAQTPFTNETEATRAQYAAWLRDLQEWWLAAMLDRRMMLREKMVLFWHNHFVSDATEVMVAQYMYRQNELFRELAAGDFRELATRVTIDPAMLIYLNGDDNKAGNPNENYARELLELFTLGTGAYDDGTPHYTERDIIELARALTGWTVNAGAMAGEFRPPRFDGGQKTILGATGNFGVAGKTPDDVIATILASVDRDHALPRAAIFLCSKLYRHFVHDVPDIPVVVEMARALVDGNWSVDRVILKLLASAHFFDDNVIGARIKSPVELVAGAFHELGLAPVWARNNQDPTRPETHDVVTATTNLAQRLLYPPNVKGWPGGRAWISSATIPLRIRYARLWIEPIAGSLQNGFDPVGWVKRLPEPTKVRSVLDRMIALLLPLDVSQQTYALLLDELLAGGPEYDWNPDAPNAASRIRACLIRITGLAEYQLT